MYRIIFLTVVAIGLLASSVSSESPKMINYQGLIIDSTGSPLDTTVSIEFTIYDALSAGNVKWTETHPSVIISEGLFEVILGAVVPIEDSVFNQPDRYLAVKVGSYPEMSPRTQLVSVGYSHRVNTVDGSSGGNITSKVSIGPGHTNTGANTFVAGVNNTADNTSATVSGGSFNKARGIYSVVAGGGGATSADSNSASGANSTIGGGRRNVASVPFATVGGGNRNTASGIRATVGGGDGNTASGFQATVSGGFANIAIDIYATVSGGVGNTARGNSATVGGGNTNSASGDYATVGGGQEDTASGAYATVSGGEINTASGEYSTVSGGRYNKARGIYSVVAGGGGDLAFDSNLALGEGSVIPGGRRNIAAGKYSFAAGHWARALHEGCFVWSDNSILNEHFSSTTINQFSVRASGGTRIYSDPYEITGVTLAAGASSWSAVSDSALKRNVREVNYHEVLEKVAALQISQWSYKAQDESIEHIGPMAQDFYRLFGLGEDDKHINTLDPDGVALAAIKALYKENQELKDRLRKLEDKVERLTD